MFTFQIPLILTKEKGLDDNGMEVLKCGFKIGGGIDQDYKRSPQGYADNVGYKTCVNENTVLSVISHFTELNSGLTKLINFRHMSKRR